MKWNRFGLSYNKNHVNPVNWRPFVLSDVGLTVTDLGRRVGRSFFFAHAAADFATSDMVAVISPVSTESHPIIAMYTAAMTATNGLVNTPKLKKKF